MKEIPKSLKRRPTKTTPYIHIDFSKGVIYFRGKSSPENTTKFYEPVLKAVRFISRLGKEELTANFRMKYFNTSSSRFFFTLVRELKAFESNGMKVTINWYVEEGDEDMEETGLDFQDMFDIPFAIRKVPARNKG